MDLRTWDNAYSLEFLTSRGVRTLALKSQLIDISIKLQFLSE